MKYRTEFDSIGKIKVPGDKYWGASTQRSNKYFNIGEFLVRPILIQSIAIVKKSAAIVHLKNKEIDKNLIDRVYKYASIKNIWDKNSSDDEKIMNILNIKIAPIVMILEILI